MSRDLIAMTPLPPAGPANVWCVSLNVSSTAASELRALLTPTECARADAYPHPARGRRFALGRAALRLLLGAQLSRDPRTLAFVANADGKPSLAPREAGDALLHFNVSHAGDDFLVATCREGPVGADLSAVHPRLPVESVARRFFCDAERRAIDSAGDECGRLERFSRLWVRKEAWLKAVGTGISERMRQLDLSAALDVAEPRGSAVVVTAPDGWEVRDLAGLPPGLMGAVATRPARGVSA